MTPNAAKTFYLAKRIQGRYRRVKIGPFPETTVEQARRQAAKLHGQIAEGYDPAEQQRMVRAQMTLGELWEVYFHQYAKLHKRPKSQQEDQAQYERHLHKWAGRRLDQIKRGDVAKLHAKIGTTAPVAANRALALLSKMFNVAVDHGWGGENPCKGIQRFNEQKRERYLDADELRRFLRALKGEPSELAKHAVWLMLITAQRRGSVLAMRWADIDWRRQVWTIPQTKRGHDHEVPLHPLAMAILRRRWAKAGDDDVFVLAADTRYGHFSEPIPAIKRISRAAGIRGRFTPHDLRRTWASWAIASGVPHNVVQKALDHAPGDITSAVYAHVGIEQLRDGYEGTIRAMVQSKTFSWGQHRTK